MTASRLFLPLSSLLLLAACGGPAAEDPDGAPGEVLEGTISDGMLPLDRVRSQAPLAEPEARATGAAGDAGDEGGEGEDEGEDGAEAEPAAEAESD